MIKFEFVYINLMILFSIYLVFIVFYQALKRLTEYNNCRISITFATRKYSNKFDMDTRYHHHHCPDTRTSDPRH